MITEWQRRSGKGICGRSGAWKRRPHARPQSPPHRPQGGSKPRPIGVKLAILSSLQRDIQPPRAPPGLGQATAPTRYGGSVAPTFYVSTLSRYGYAFEG